MRPKVSIVILNYITYQETKELVRGIRSKLSYSNYDIIVVDNDSPNESRLELASDADILDYVLIPNHTNSGYAVGNNVGIRYALKHGAEYTLILNNDIVINDPDVLDNMVDLCENNKRIGAVSPRILKPNSGEELQFFERPTLGDMSVGYMAFHKRRQSFDTSRICKIYRPQGCCMLLSGKAIIEINYMDERTFLYCEEEILAERLLQKNYECWLSGNTSVIHNHSVTVSSSMSKMKKAANTIESFKIYLEDYRNIKNRIQRELLVWVKYFVVMVRS
ncbi:glycosyltransferase [Jeotgalibaca porci]|uniref:glycosyltransferase n=1 Tax=Jeotgalibaca porci TaxID=1868793 RepID=UPI003F8FD521